MIRLFLHFWNLAATFRIWSSGKKNPYLKSDLDNICKATTVTHTKRIYRNLLHKETSFVYYTSSVLRKS